MYTQTHVAPWILALYYYLIRSLALCCVGIVRARVARAANFLSIMRVTGSAALFFMERQHLFTHVASTSWLLAYMVSWDVHETFKVAYTSFAYFSQRVRTKRVCLWLHFFNCCHKCHTGQLLKLLVALNNKNACMIAKCKKHMC